MHYCSGLREFFRFAFPHLLCFSRSGKKSSRESEKKTTTGEMIKENWQNAGVEKKSSRFSWAISRASQTQSFVGATFIRRVHLDADRRQKETMLVNVGHFSGAFLFAALVRYGLCLKTPHIKCSKNIHKTCFVHMSVGCSCMKWAIKTAVPHKERKLQRMCECKWTCMSSFTANYNFICVAHSASSSNEHSYGTRTTQMKFRLPMFYSSHSHSLPTGNIIHYTFTIYYAAFSVHTRNSYE